MKKKSITPTDLFLAVLALLLISVSFYQTWLGLEQIFGVSSFVIALVLSLILLFLLWQIRITKESGNSTTGLSSIYFFFALFCFVANFNALYTRFMRTDIYTAELREINERFNSLTADIESKLNYEIDDQRKRQEIVREAGLLSIQIQDTRNPGIGAEANRIIGRLEKLLGNTLTPLKPASYDAYGYQDLAQRYEAQIVGMMDNLSPDEKNLKRDLKSGELKWNKKIQDFLLLSKKDQDDLAQGLIDESLTEYNKLGNRAHNILGNAKFQFEPILSKTQEVGKIGYAFEHAIKEHGMYQMVVLAGCVLLDFGIWIIILLVPTSNNQNNNNGSVFTSKRVGRTLIPN